MVQIRRKQSPEDVNIVNEVAWTLAVTHLEPLRKPSYALEIMDHAMSADEEARKNPAYLDTWAAAYAANGNFTRAVALQQQAVDAARNRKSPTWSRCCRRTSMPSSAARPS